MISLTIRTLPPSPNQRMYWAVKKKLRETFAKEIYYAWYESGSPAWDGPRKMILTTTIYWKTRRLDEDNAMGSLKIMIDAMRDIGLIYRDSPKWLEVKKPVQMIDHEDPRVVIQLEEMT
jgi:Holliday junction resolvase RusA-like endonuclease